MGGQTDGQAYYRNRACLQSVMLYSSGLATSFWDGAQFTCEMGPQLRTRSVGETTCTRRQRVRAEAADLGTVF